MKTAEQIADEVVTAIRPLLPEGYVVSKRAWHDGHFEVSIHQAGERLTWCRMVRENDGPGDLAGALLMQVASWKGNGNWEGLAWKAFAYKEQQ